jgi:RNA polymerase sigma factor (sigma-70 family)
MRPASGNNLLPSLRRQALSGDGGDVADGQLLELFIVHKEENAFRALLQRHGPMVMGVCRRVLHNSHDAEDAFQAVFLVLARKASTILPREFVANWLYGVAYRTAHKARVTRARAAALKQRLHDRVNAMAEQARTQDEIWHDLQPVLDEELEHLPDRYRLAIVLCDLEGKSRKQAARELNWTPGTLSGRLARARKLLAGRLAQRGVSLSVAALSTVLTRSNASAAVPAALNSNLTRAALVSACGNSIPAGIVSPSVALLLDGVLKSMLLKKLKIGGLCLAVLGVALSTAGLLAHRALATARIAPHAGAAKRFDDIQKAALDERAGLADAEMHVIGIYGPKAKPDNSKRVDVEVRPTAKPVVLVLSSYYSVDWHIKFSPGARVKKVIVSGYFEQEIKQLPAGVPVRNQSYFPADGSRRKEGWFYAYQWNTFNWREMVRALNDQTGLLVSSFQSENDGISFVVDGIRGREFAQKQRKPRRTFQQLKPGELLAACAGADLHAVSIYQAGPRKKGDQVDIEIKPTVKPMVLALASYDSVLWNLRMVPGANVKAVIIGGYYDQELEGVPDNIPVAYTAYCPARQLNYFYCYDAATPEFLQMTAKLDELTRLPLSTCQVQYAGNSFIIDGVRGNLPAQKQREKPRERDEEAARADQQDPLADVADIPALEKKAAGDVNKRYFMIGPKKNTKAPAEGYGLVVILPGGDGSAEFLPFVKRIYKNALPDNYLAAQPIAKNWAPAQQIVWPTKTNPVDKMQFNTEEFVDAVIQDVNKKFKIDRKKVFTLSWSSSGPAAYATALRNPHSVAGSFIAMSVFNPRFLPPLEGGKGHSFYLLHSEQDRVCPYRMAEQAKQSLTEIGAKVRLETYEGGHGWRGDVFGNIHAGIGWLEKNGEDPKP